MNEKALTDLAVGALSADFDVWREVTGKNLLTGSPIRVDIVAKPKSELIAAGFADGYFCIEVKAIPAADATKKARDLAWQAVSYRLSEFDFGAPIFALVFPRLAEFYTAKQKAETGGSIEYCTLYGAACREVEILLQRGNVGWLEIRNNPADLVIGFGAWRYWSRRAGVTPVKNYGLKLHVGTRK